MSGARFVGLFMVRPPLPGSKHWQDYNMGLVEMGGYKKKIEEEQDQEIDPPVKRIRIFEPVPPRQAHPAHLKPLTRDEYN